MLRDLIGLMGQGPELRGDGRHVPEEVEPDVVPLHAVHCLQQVLLEKRHDGGDLRLRALPVLRGEGVDREVLDADVLAVRRDAAEGLGSHLVSRGAGQAPLGGPAAIAIHDNGNVTGQVGHIHLPRLVHGNVLCHQTAISSFSFLARSSSIFLQLSSVIF